MSKTFIPTADPRAIAVAKAIQTGDIAGLQAQLAEHKELILAYIGSPDEGRTLLHLLTDFPGHLPNNTTVVKLLIDAGCDINAPFAGKHSEAPIHWAASCDDVEVLDALLDAGVDINARGGFVAETPLANARAYQQLKCAHRLVERGATVTLSDAAALGLLDKAKAMYAGDPKPTERDLNRAFWNACRGSQLQMAKFLHEHGADINFLAPWCGHSPLDEAKKQKVTDLVKWLESLGAKGTEQ